MRRRKTLQGKENESNGATPTCNTKPTINNKKPRKRERKYWHLSKLKIIIDVIETEVTVERNSTKKE